MKYPVKRLSVEELDKEPFCPEQPTIYEIIWGKTKYELLVNYVPNSRKMAAFGTGTVNRKRLPDFKRNSWYPDIPVTSIWYADPTLYEGELSLYWYYGTNKRWHLKNIAFLLAAIAKKQSLSLEDSLFFGSSGGGYSSLVLATLLHGKAYVINPQIFLENYFKDYYKMFLADVLSKGEKPAEERISIISLFKAERYIPRIHYVQNMQSKHDIRLQVTPFLRRISEGNMDCSDTISMEFFYAEGGHNAMPDKDRSLVLIARGLEDKATGVAISTGEEKHQKLTFFERVSCADFKNPGTYLLFDELDEFGAAFLGTSIAISGGSLDFALQLTKQMESKYEFAYYLQSEKATIERLPYTNENKVTFRLPSHGNYKVRCFVKAGNNKYSFASESIEAKASAFK